MENKNNFDSFLHYYNFYIDENISKEIEKVIAHDDGWFVTMLKYFKEIDRDIQKEYLLKIMQFCDYKTSILIRNKNYELLRKVINNIETVIIGLLNEEKFNKLYLSLTIKQVYCELFFSNYKRAYYKSSELIRYFLSNFTKLKKKAGKDVKAIESLANDLIQTRSVLKLLYNELNRQNLIKQKNKIQVASKQFELLILKTNFIDYSQSDYLIINPSINYSDRVEYITLYEQLSNVKKFSKKVKIKFKIEFLKILNRFDRFFWGYRQSILKLVRSSFILILLYSVLMQYNIIKINDQVYTETSKNFISKIYFSIVTFTSLGFGDIIPNNDNLSRLLIASEAVMGLICISLIIYLIGKKSGS